MSDEYKKLQDAANIKKTQEIVRRLPSFTKAYFMKLNTDLNEKSTRTPLGYAGDIETFFYFLTKQNPEIKSIADITPAQLDRLTPVDIDEYISWLTEYERDGKVLRNTAVSKRRKISALKSFWKHHQKYGVLENNPTTLVEMKGTKKSKEIKRVRSEEIPDIYENITDGKTLTKKSKAASSHLQKRDIAIISLFLGTGLRVSELVGINIEDLDFKENSVLVHRKGEGNISQRSYFNEAVAASIKDYINNERLEPQDGSTALFVSRINTRLGVRAVEKMVKKYVDPVTVDNMTPHKLRATYATELYGKTRDIYVVRDAMNHKEVASTEHYAHVGNDIVKEAAEKVDWV